MSAPDFTVDVFENEYLPDGAREVNAIVTVTSAGSAADRPASAASAAEIIIVDCSFSMAMPWKKLIQARQATAAAIDVIADARTRKAAKRSVCLLYPHPDTAIGQWLGLARELFATREDTLRHAILLTDGQNVGESAAELAAAIELCVGVFRCDCRRQ
jgi:hypothetical protein